MGHPQGAPLQPGFLRKVILFVMKELSVILLHLSDTTPSQRSLDSIFPLPPKTDFQILDPSVLETAAQAQGRILYFLNSGEVCPFAYDHLIFSTIHRPNVMIGAFKNPESKKKLSCFEFESVISFHKHQAQLTNFFVRRAAFVEAGAAAFR